MLAADAAIIGTQAVSPGEAAASISSGIERLVIRSRIAGFGDRLNVSGADRFAAAASLAREGALP